MAEVDNKHITFVDEDGTETLCEILFTYHSEEFEKDYVFFIASGNHESDDEDEKTEVGVASYIPNEDGSVGKVFVVESDEEWAMLEDVLGGYIDDMENGECDCGCDCCCEDDCDCEDEGCECCHHHDDDDNGDGDK